MGVSESYLEERVDTVLGTAFDERAGRVVPSSSDVALKDGAVNIEATFLYADLAGSAKLSSVCPWGTTAKIIRSFLDISTRLIRAHGGEIRSFDGDRVMGVFIGDSKNTSASRCGREIHWIVRKILNTKAQAKFASIRNNNIEIRHCVGIDTGTVRAVRSGIRNHNDLIWIGKPASFSAKLSDVRDSPFHTYISSRTLAKLHDSERRSGQDEFWTPTSFNFAGKTETVYKTNHWKRPK